MSRTPPPLPAPSGKGPGSAVGPFMMYAMPAPGGVHHAAAGYLDAIYWRKWMVLGIVAAAVAGTWLVTLLRPKMYESTATLRVERVGSGSEPAAADMDRVVATHARMVASDAVLRPVASKFKLSEDGGRASNSKGTVRLRGLQVSRPPDTYLIQVTYRHRDPEIAAAVANEIAATYVQRVRAARDGGDATLASESQRQLEELRRRMEEGNAALAEYQRRIGDMDPDGKTNVLAARMLQLNTDYARAQAERAEKQAAYDTVRTGMPEAAEASAHGDLVKKLLERHADASQKLSDVKALYDENHPEYKRLSALLRELDEQLKTQYPKAVQRAESDLRQARLREANLKAAYESSKAEVDRVSAQAVEYRALKQRAEADRALYEQVSRKLGEAEIESGLQGAPVRLADAARPDYKPVTPNVALNCAVALFSSLLVGCAAAIVIERRRERIRGVDQLKTLCDVELVSVLPAVARWRGKEGAAMFSSDSHKLKRGDLAMARYREDVRMLRNGLDSARVFAIISPEAREGRSRLAFELASAFASGGRRTLLVDGNLRAPVLHATLYPTCPENGVASAIAGVTGWRGALMPALDGNAPDLLPAGMPDPRSSDLLHQNISDLLGDAASEYDRVVVDTPPFLRSSESLDILRCVDAAIVVARAGETGRKQLEAMMHYLRRMGARVAAAVLWGEV